MGAPISESLCKLPCKHFMLVCLEHSSGSRAANGPHWRTVAFCQSIIISLHCLSTVFSFTLLQVPYPNASQI